MVEKVQDNKTVFFTYKVTDDQDGSILEQSIIPIGYVHGVANYMFPEVENALHGKQVSDSISVSLTPEQHFGEYDESITFSDKLENVPVQFQKLGSEAEFTNDNGLKTVMSVVKIADGKVYLDGNHPFAGKNVTYSITITSINDATPAEIKKGHPRQTHPSLK